MSPEAIMHNDVAAARKTKCHDHAEITNHVAAKDGVKHEKAHTNSVASKKSEITLKEVVCLVPNLKLMNC
jgi:hypothetical protein